MAVDAVIFDWGGTLTPWHSIDPDVPGLLRYLRGRGIRVGVPRVAIHPAEAVRDPSSASACGGDRLPGAATY